MNDPVAARAALTAFLRGVERRGVVFAHWQGGDAALGDAALAATLRGFAQAAPGLPFAEWPRRFWAMLLAAPQLRGAGGASAEVPAAVAGLGSGPRAALLLRVVAGLAESEAAAVLGIARPTYRLALQRALPHRDDGSADPDAWRALSQSAQLAVRAVPAERLETIALLRDGLRPPPVRTAGAPEAARRPAWLWPSTLAVGALTAGALAATWWGPWLPAPETGGGERIRIEDLPPPAAPAARFDPAGTLASHRDLALLLDEATGVFADDADPAFDAWLVMALGQDDRLPPVPDTTRIDEGAASQEQVDAPR
ncbi:hypothetical protein [Luteimonas sp. SDU82]|uniref:hypothetical protein n=1 Tax=Luteimonas sp. SDU82 TaxID=3422592 RepID=UPI003EBF592E